MLKKRILWIAAILALCLFLRGILLALPLYAWGRSQGLRIMISPLSSFGTHRLDIRGLRVRDSNGVLFLSADHVWSEYNPSLLFHGQLAASPLGSIVFDKPRLTLQRDLTGSWSPSLKFAPSDEVENLKARIVVQSGEIHLLDEFWRNGKNPSSLSIDSVEGTMDFSLPHQITVDFGAGTKLGGLIKAQGRLSRPSYAGVLQLALRQLPFSMFGNYLLHSESVSFASGTLNGTSSLWISRLGLASASASLRVSGGALSSTQIGGIKITNLSSNLSIEKSRMRFDDLQGRLGSSQFQGSGVMALSTAPRYFFSFHDPNLSLSDLSGLSESFGKINPRGNSTLDLSLSGNDSDFLLEGNLEAPHFFLNSTPESNLLIHFSRLNDFFSLDLARWKGKEETVSIQGIAKPDDYASFLVQGNDIPLADLLNWGQVATGDAALSRSSLLPRGGRATFTVLLSRAHQNDTVAATGKLQDFTVAKTKIAQFGSHLLFSDDEGWVDDLALKLENGNLHGNGVWLGKAPSFFGGELQGNVENKSVHSYLFGQGKDLFLADSSALFHGTFPSSLSGIIDVAKWPLHLDFEPASLHALASGLLLFHEEPGTAFSGFGVGSLTETGTENHLPLTIPVSKSFFDDADWSLGVHQGRGGLSVASPSLAFFGKTNPTDSRFFFVAETARSPFSLAAGGEIRYSLPVASRSGQLLWQHNLPLYSLTVLGRGRLRGKPAAFSGDLIGSDKTLRLNHLEGVWGHSQYDVTGDLSLPVGQSQTFNFEGSTTEAEISDLTTLFPNTPLWLRGLSGDLTGHFSVLAKKSNPLSGRPGTAPNDTQPGHGSGTAPNDTQRGRPTGSASPYGGNLAFFIRDGTFWGQPISSAYLESRIQNGALNFNPLVVRSSEDYLFARGVVGSNGAMNFSFEVPQLSLAHVAAFKPSKRNLEGLLEMKGNATGSIFSPVIAANIQLGNFQNDRIHLDKIFAHAFYKDRTFRISHAQFVNGLGDLSGNATLSLGSPTGLSADLAFSHFDLESLLSWHAMRSFGFIDGRVYLSGPLPRIDGNFDLHLSEKGIPTGGASGVISRGVASFSTLKLRVGDGEVTGSGTLNVQKPSSLHVEGNNLDLQFLAQLFQDLPGSLSGTGTFKGEVRTSIENPEMNLDVTLAHPALGQLSASSMSGKLIYRKGQILLDGAQVFEPHGVLKLEGTIPVSPGSKRKIFSPFALRLKLENQDLKLLSDLYPKISASGATNADFSVLFETKRYLVNGDAHVRNGTLLLPGMLNEIEDLQGDVRVEQNSLRFSARGNLSNPVEASGDFSITGDSGSPVLGDGQLQLTGEKLAVDIPHAHVHLTPDMRLSYESGKWKLSGNATVEDGDLSTELFTSSLQRQLFPKLIQLELDATVNVSEGVHFLHPHLAAEGSGYLKIAGTVSHPQLSGVLSGNKGTMDFLGHEFIVKHGSATFSKGHKLPYLGLEGVSIRRVQGSLITIKLSGYPGDLHLEIASDPPLSPRELSATFNQHQPIERYTSGTTSQFMQQEAAHWLSTGIESELFYPIENVFGSAFKLEYFSFEFLPTGQLGLQVGKEISPHVAVTYSRAVGGRIQNATDPGAIWGLDYQLSPRVILRGTQDSLTGPGGQILSKWNF